MMLCDLFFSALEENTLTVIVHIVWLMKELADLKSLFVLCIHVLVGKLQPETWELAA